MLKHIFIIISNEVSLSHIFSSGHLELMGSMTSAGAGEYPIWKGHISSNEAIEPFGDLGVPPWLRKPPYILYLKRLLLSFATYCFKALFALCIYIYIFVKLSSSSCPFHFPPFLYALRVWIEKLPLWEAGSNASNGERCRHWSWRWFEENRLMWANAINLPWLGSVFTIHLW